MPSVIRTTKTAPQANRLGEAAKPNPTQNCMTCARFVACRDSKKHYRYRCTRWQELPQLDGGGGITDLLGKPMESAKDKRPAKIIKPTKAEMKAAKLDAAAGMDGGEDAVESALMEMVNASLNSDSDIPPDFVLQDGDIPEADNFYHWMTGPEFGNNHSILFPKQFEVMMNIEGCYCPRCSDPDWIVIPKVDSPLSEIEDRIVLLKRGICPQCKATKSELVASGELHENYMTLGIVGQRGSKTYTLAMYENYMIHRWLKCPDPQKLMRVGSGQILSGMYVALTFEQIQKNFMEPLNSFTRDTAWFKNYHAFLKGAAERQGVKELYNHGILSLKYYHRKLHFHAASANKRTLRGSTGLSRLVDEAGWFPFGKSNEDKERATGEEVFTAMNNSLATVVVAHERHVREGKNFIPKPYMALISSPSDINDLVMSMRRENEGSKTVYSFKYPTWEFNPNVPRSSAFIEQLYRSDPVKAERDFGANPPLSSSGWIIGAGNVFPVFSGPPNPVQTRQFKLKSKTLGVSRTGAEVVKISQTFTGGRVLVLDASNNGNSFAWCVASKDHETGKTYIDALGEVQPSKDAPIAWEKLYSSLFAPICENMGIQACVSDHWQSIAIKERMEEEFEVAPFTHRLKYQHFCEAKAAFYDRKLVLPSLGSIDTEEGIFSKAREYPARFLGEPEAHLFYQILSVREIVGTRLEKGSGTEDDLFRVMVLANYALSWDKVLEVLGEDEQAPPEVLDIGLVMSAGRGGGTRANIFGSVSSLPKVGAGQAAGGKVATRERASGGGSEAIGITSSFGSGGKRA